MVTLATTEDFSQSSGVINFPQLDNIYESFIDESFAGMGETITLHLQPSIQQNTTTESENVDARHYNPFFGQAVRPPDSTKRSAVNVTYRDILFTAHISIGPKETETVFGIPLKANQCDTTLAIESQSYIESAISATIRSKRYRLATDVKTIGLIAPKYLIARWEEISEEEA